MVCKNCGKEFEFLSENDSTKCPFCGTVHEIKKFNDEESFEEALRYIFETFGAEQFDNGNTLLSNFERVAPELTRYQRLLDIVVKSGIRDNFAKADSSSAYAVVEDSIKILEDDYFLARKVAAKLAEALAYAHGFDLNDENKVDLAAKGAISTLILSAGGIDDVCEAMKFAKKREVPLIHIGDVIDKALSKLMYQATDIDELFSIKGDIEAHADEMFADGNVSPFLNHLFGEVLKRFIDELNTLDEIFEATEKLKAHDLLENYSSSFSQKFESVISSVSDIDSLLDVTNRMSENGINVDDYTSSVNAKLGEIISDIDTVDDLLVLTNRLKENNISLSDIEPVLSAKIKNIISTINDIDALFEAYDNLKANDIDSSIYGALFSEKLKRFVVRASNITELNNITAQITEHGIEFDFSTELVSVLHNCINNVAYSDDLINIADYARNAGVYDDIQGSIIDFLGNQITATDSIDSLRTLLEYVDENSLCSIDVSLVVKSLEKFVASASNIDEIFDIIRLASDYECADMLEESVSEAVIGFVADADDIVVLNDIYNQVIELGMNDNVKNVVINKLTKMLDRIDTIKDLSLLLNFMSDNDISNEVYVSATIRKFLNNCTDENGLAEVINFAYKNNIFESIQTDASRVAGKLISKSRNIDEIKSYLVFVENNNLNYNFDLAVKAALNNMVDAAQTIDDIKVINDYIKEEGWFEGLIINIKNKTYDAFAEADMTGDVQGLLDSMSKIIDDGKYKLIRESIVSVKIINAVKRMIDEAEKAGNSMLVDEINNFAFENNININGEQEFSTPVDYDVNAELGNMYYNNTPEDVCSFITDLQSLKALNNYFSGNDISLDNEDVRETLGNKLKEFLSQAADIFDVEAVKEFVVRHCQGCGYEELVREEMCRLLSQSKHVANFLELVTELRTANKEFDFEEEIRSAVNGFLERSSGIDDMLSIINEMSGRDIVIDLEKEGKAAVIKLIANTDDISTLGFIMKAVRNFTYFEDLTDIEDAAKQRICRFILRTGNIKGIIEIINIAKSKGLEYDYSNDISTYISKILSGTVDMDGLITNLGIVKTNHLCKNPEKLAVDAVTAFIGRTETIESLVAILKKSRDNKIDVDDAAQAHLKDLLNKCVSLDEVDTLVKDAEKNKLNVRNQDFFTDKLRDFADEAKDLSELNTLKKYIRLTNDFEGKAETTAVVNNKIVNLTTSVNPVALDSIYSLLKEDRDFPNLNDMLSNGIKNYYNRLCVVNSEDDVVRVIDKLRKDVSTYEKKIELFNNGVKDDKYGIYVTIANICNTKIYELNNMTADSFNSTSEAVVETPVVAPVAEPVASSESVQTQTQEPVVEQSVTPEPVPVNIEEAKTPEPVQEPVQATQTTFDIPDVVADEEEEPTDPVGKIYYEVSKWDITKENNVGNAASRVESILRKINDIVDSSSKGGKKKGKKDGDNADIAPAVDLLAQKLWNLINIPKYHIDFDDYVGTKNYIQEQIGMIDALKCCKAEEFNKLKKFIVDATVLSEVKLNFKKKRREFKEYQNYYEQNKNNEDAFLTISMYEAFTKDEAVRDALYTSGGSGSMSFDALLKGFGRKKV